MRPGLAAIVVFAIMLCRSWFSRALTPSARFRMRSAPSSLFRLFSHEKAPTPLSLYIESPEDMHDLGAILSQIATQRGDVLLLDGDLGAGKTCLSRGFVQTLVGDDQRVTSPTYLLCNSYPIIRSNVERNDSPRTVHHMDLYRLSGDEQDLVPLNLDRILDEDVSLIEWPQRLGSKVPKKRLDINLRIVHTEDSIYDETCQPRRVTLTPVGLAWEDRLKGLQTEGYIDDWIEMDSG